MLIKYIYICLLCITTQVTIISCDLFYDPVPNHSIQVTSPIIDTEIKVGEYLKIKWECRDVSDYVRLDIYNNGLYINTIDAQAPNHYEYLWYPSENLKHSENYQIKISDVLDSNIYVFSDKFLIYKAIIFSDNNLNVAISNSLGNPEEITTKDLIKITDLNASSKNIWNIDGLSNCANLINLNLSDNHIYNISDIAELTAVETLNISGNPIIDMNPVKLLGNLRQLDVSNLNITDLYVYSNLIKMTRFDAGNNQINDITGISSFSELKILSLNDNNIVDISKIENLYNLDYINLSDNQVTDIEPLIINPGINNGDVIILSGNPLNDISFNNYIHQLVERGVMVIF